MKIQYVSDIHLEFHDKHNVGSINPTQFVKTGEAEYLALCGDIGIPELAAYEVFLKWCSGFWKAVFVIAGNHEYYNVRCPVKHTMKFKKEFIENICRQLPNVHFLDCSSVFLAEENMRVLGCTLWSQIDESIQDKAMLNMSDTRQILLDEDHKAYPEELCEIHRRERKWLADAIESCRTSGERCIVLTHYLPSYQLIDPKYWGFELNSCFASDLDHLIQTPVCAWLCGHSHTAVFKLINGVPCSLNPYGYPNEADTKCNRACIIDIQ